MVNTVVWIIVFSYFIQKIKCGKVLNNCDCGASNIAYKNRIIGGADTSPHEYPWVAGIFDETNNIFCGGSVITNRHILTAGHCVYYTNPFKLHALLGLHDRIRQDGIRYDFQDVLLHPKFEAKTYHDIYDVAIIETDRKIIFNDRIRPICLPLLSSKSYNYDKATVAGWGRLSAGGKNSRFLQETKVVIQPEEVCRNTNIGSFLEPEIMICGYSKRADACQGDSGGPLFLETMFNRFEQFGIISFGIGCGTENTPGIYSRVTTVLPWIEKVTSKADTCRDIAKLSLDYK